MGKPTPTLYQAIRNQREWIEQCGGTLAGYLANYGPTHGDDGARAIYAADREVLDDLLGKWDRMYAAKGTK